MNTTAQIQDKVVNENYLYIPSNLYRFINQNTEILQSGTTDRLCYCFEGILSEREDERICPKCGGTCHVHGHETCTLRHICFGYNYSKVLVNRSRFCCQSCSHTYCQSIVFKAEDHFITKALEHFIVKLLDSGLTLKACAQICSVNRKIVKDIDLKRLKGKYKPEDCLIKPDKPSRVLMIDEFLLHKGHKYATHIVDHDTGHVLWIQIGKKKQVVYDFIEHVGEDFMYKVEAVACDMNSDFAEAFREKFPHITIVYDRFHIIKNFNEKVIAPIRKEEQQRLIKEGKLDEARRLKRSRFILTSKRSTLQKKDRERRAQDPKAKSTESLYDTIINENKLLLNTDIIKELLDKAYESKNATDMENYICEINTLCQESDNRHLKWFGNNILMNHIDGIIGHATFNVSSGRIEGINNKIKTIRRQAYGFRDTEYFFLKIMDASRQKYSAEEKSHIFFP